MLIAISVGVIISCLLSSILVLVCCFCSKCPLYSVCHSKYEHNDTIAFCKFLPFRKKMSNSTFFFHFFYHSYQRGIDEIKWYAERRLQNSAKLWTECRSGSSGPLWCLTSASPASAVSQINTLIAVLNESHRIHAVNLCSFMISPHLMLNQEASYKIIFALFSTTVLFDGEFVHFEALDVIDPPRRIV